MLLRNETNPRRPPRSPAELVLRTVSAVIDQRRRWLDPTERCLGDETRGVHDARDRRFGVEAVEVDEGEDGLGADDDGEVAPQLLECCRDRCRVCAAESGASA